MNSKMLLLLGGMVGLSEYSNGLDIPLWSF